MKYKCKKYIVVLFVYICSASEFTSVVFCTTEDPRWFTCPIYTYYLYNVPSRYSEASFHFWLQLKHTISVAYLFFMARSWCHMALKYIRKAISPTASFSSKALFKLFILWNSLFHVGVEIYSNQPTIYIAQKSFVWPTDTNPTDSSYRHSANNTAHRKFTYLYGFIPNRWETYIFIYWLSMAIVRHLAPDPPFQHKFK